MGVITFLIVLAAVVVATVVGGKVVSSLVGDAPKQRRELRTAKLQLRTAKNALRHIASDVAGNPVLEAQIALDEIESSDLKELE